MSSMSTVSGSRPVSGTRPAGVLATVSTTVRTRLAELRANRAALRSYRAQESALQGLGHAELGDALVAARRG